MLPSQKLVRAVAYDTLFTGVRCGGQSVVVVGGGPLIDGLELWLSFRDAIQWSRPLLYL